MFLIIPVIEISHSHVVYKVHGEEGVEYPSDPAALARVWRKENAKVLHVTDRDSLPCHEVSCIDSVHSIVRAVDIPIEISGDIRTYAQCESLFNAGIYRVVINAAMTDHAEIARMVEDFLPQRIVAGFTAAHDEVLDIEGKPLGISSIALGHAMKAIGITRAVYRNVDSSSGEMVLDLDALKSFAVETKLRVTAGGGVQNVQDLWALQALEPFGVDSTIMSKALYENRFPCQELWRKVEADEVRA